jgi:hypothetical protein
MQIRITGITLMSARAQARAVTERDIDSGLARGQVVGTPTLFIDGVVHRGGYDPPLAALAP